MGSIFNKVFAAAIFLSFNISYETNAQQVEGGYGSSYSVYQGDPITFYISSSTKSNTLTIYQITDIAHYVTAYTNVQFRVQTTSLHSDSTYWYGCGWDSTFGITIPLNWSPGVYRAEFRTYYDSTTNMSDSVSGILFIVKPKILASTSSNLLLIATNTWQAYNDYGGKSLYNNISTNHQRSFKVSFSRPANRPLGSLGSADFYKYERKFINWTTLNNIPLEYASMYDLDRDPNFLFDTGNNNRYKVLFIVGHNEYWSIAERQQCEQFIRNGGKVIILSGNTCWWQVRFENNGSTMVCYKDSAADRNANPTIPDSLITVNWWKSPVNNPENSFTGVNFKDGGYVNSGNKLPKSQGFGDYTAFNTHYWLFNGTGLREGDEFGYKNAIVGYEADGTPTGWDAKGLGVPINTDQSKTPVNFRIFGFSPTVNYDTTVGFGHATMGMYYAQNTNKGAVFNAATTDWADGLLTDANAGITPDTIVEKITMNVYQKFTENRFPPEILSWSPYQKYFVYRNADPVYLSIRDTVIAPGDTIQLSFTAENPFPALQTSLNYFWKVDGTVVSSGSNYTFTNKESSINKKQFTVTGYAKNDKDTASISWHIYDYPVVIYTVPLDSIPKGAYYEQRFRAYHQFADTTTFTLGSNYPQWLSIQEDSGFVRGTAPGIDTSYQVAVIAKSKNGYADTLNYTLKVAGVSGIDEEKLTPLKFELSQNYPNPFNPTTNIGFSVPSGRDLAQSGRIPSASGGVFVSLKVYDVLGREVATLVNEEKPAGNYIVKFDGSNLASGIYFYRLTAGNYTMVKKMVLIR